MKVKLGDRTYRVQLRAPPGQPPSWGMVIDHNNGRTGDIYLRRGMTRTKLFQTLIHEALHAEFPLLSEEAVSAADRRIATFMLRVLDAMEAEAAEE